MSGRTYRAPTEGVVFGVLAAWLLPSYLVPAILMAPTLLREMAYGPPETIPPGLVLLPLLGLIVGLPGLLIGYGGWAILHRKGKRQPVHAACLGALAGAVQGVAVGGLFGTLFQPFILWALLLTGIGALVGLVVWRIAYRRAPVS